MRVLITGGTGFVGPAIVRAVLDAGHDVTLLVHEHTGPFSRDTPRLTFVKGDVTDASAVRAAVQGHDAVIHLVAIRRAFGDVWGTFRKMHTEATRVIVDAAKAAGVERIVFMSASGVKPEGTPYQVTKWESEELVKSSGLAWTIFRPTFVTGPVEDGSLGFDQEFADIVRKAPVLPAFGGGEFTMQPVAKRDVATAFARALEVDAAVGKTYLLAGPRRLTWKAYLQNLAHVLAKKRVLAPVPKWFILPVAGALDRYRWFPASRAELVMLMEGHSGDGSPAERDLSFTYTPYDEALAEALAVEVTADGRRARGGAPSH